MAESSYRIRVSEDLKRAFLKVAEATDRNGAQLVRQYMREYVKDNKDALQRSFLDDLGE